MNSGFKRVYAKNGRWWFVDTANKWLPLTRIDDGKPALARAVHALVPNKASASCLSGAIDDFRRKDIGADLAASTKEKLTIYLASIEAAFSQFPSPAEIEPVDIERFLDQWNGHPCSQQGYRSVLIRVFRRAVLRGDCKYNPAREIPAVAVKKRDRYVEDDELVQMLDMAATRGRCIIAADRHALIWQLAYLTGQRLTDVRLLRKSDVSATHLRFQPTKTMKTTKASVDVPITADIRAVLDQAAALKLSPGIDSMYVIARRNGQPFSGPAVTCMWRRVRERCGLQDSNLLCRDLRSKALSDGEFKQGLEVAQLQKAGTHADAKMTRHYLRKRPTPESPLRLEMPRKKRV
jgi:integrase